jgi:hypothetical protein
MFNLFSRIRAGGFALLGISDVKPKEVVLPCNDSVEALQLEIGKLQTELYLCKVKVQRQQKEIELLMKLILKSQRPGSSLSVQPDTVRPVYIMTERGDDFGANSVQIVKISLFIPSIFTESKVGYVKIKLSRQGHFVSRPYIKTEFDNVGIEDHLLEYTTRFLVGISIQYPGVTATYEMDDDVELLNMVGEFFD